MKKIIHLFFVLLFIIGCGKNPDAEKMIQKANSLIEKKDHKSAIKTLDECILKYPDYAPAYNRKGIALDYIGEYFDAKKNYEKAIQLDPDFDQAYINLGNSYSNMKNFSKAIECYEKAIEIKPSLARVYYYLGLAQIERGDRQQGIENIKKSASMTYEQAQNYLKNIGEDW